MIDHKILFISFISHYVQLLQSPCSMLDHTEKLPQLLPFCISLWPLFPWWEP
jgi:hypothetical protein